MPKGWLSPEEQLKNSDRGIYTVDGELKVPSNLFQFVDMQDISEKIFVKGRPRDSTFFDNKGLVAPFLGQYSVATEIMTARIFSDN